MLEPTQQSQLIQQASYMRGVIEYVLAFVGHAYGAQFLGLVVYTLGHMAVAGYTLDLRVMAKLLLELAAVVQGLLLTRLQL